MSSAADYEVVDSEKPITLANVRPFEDFVRMGRYCYLILIFSEFLLLSGAGNMVYMVYAGAAPRSVSCVGSNFTIEDVCKQGLNHRELTDCELKIDYEFKSINVEFEYVCKETALVKSSISVQMTGVLVGTLLFGSLSDRFGRLKILMFSFSMTSFVSIFCSFSTSLTMFTVLRTILGFFTGGVIGTYGVYKMEQIPKKHRFWVATVIAWAPNFIFINAIAFLANDWRTFQQIIFAISCPAFVLYFYVYESPRWLIQRGRISEAREVMQNIQRIDRANDLKKEEMEKMLDVEYQKHLAKEGKMKNYTIRHLFYTPSMALATVVLCSGVFFTSMINYGLVFNMESLAGSLFLNSVIMGLLRWFINIITGVLDYKYKVVGRKLVHFVSQATIAFSLGSIATIYYFDIHEEYKGFIRWSTIIATATTSQIFISKTILAMEFYPTVVRNSALAFKSTCSRVGTICAPQLFILAASTLTIPYTILFLMATADTIFFQITLPETKGRALPENLPPKRRKKSGLDEEEKMIPAPKNSLMYPLTTTKSEETDSKL
ncbi:unnamed protein product [Auanema sp. JU1783]|nr:unnamed protein product [Auanema sp. JU1783]